MRNIPLEQKIFSIQTHEEFESCALELFSYQYKHNSLYSEFVNIRGKHPKSVSRSSDIPFLPISFFKTHRVISTKNKPELFFTSSGTQGIRSCHFIYSPDVYNTATHLHFESIYGSLSEYLILGLLPSYMENPNSSLIYMISKFIEKSKHTNSGFFLKSEHELYSIIESNQDKKIICFGVSFSLLDFAEKYTVSHPNITIIETGGMKGKRKEITRDELHARLQKSFSVSEIHSEYGMTELLSQAYAQKNGIFTPPPWMQIKIRDIHDPFEFAPTNKSGIISVIDLANIYSCAFIETQDIGRKTSDTNFTVEGRIDTADLRGCNLLI